MKREDIIQMAREAGNADLFDAMQVDFLQRFAALVAAAKDAEHQEAMRWDVHSCGPTCKRYACVAVRDAVAAEREACANVCDEQDELKGHTPFDCAAAIRARSKA
jgi:hypothetical protein